MKYIISLCLLNYLYCIPDIYHISHLNKYEKIEIYSVGQVGNIALNITKFDLGDTIFITYTSYKRPYKNFIKYTFSNSDTVYPNLEYLNKTVERLMIRVPEQHIIKIAGFGKIQLNIMFIIIKLKYQTTTKQHSFCSIMI